MYNKKKKPSEHSCTSEKIPLRLHTLPCFTLLGDIATTNSAFIEDLQYYFKQCQTPSASHQNESLHSPQHLPVAHGMTTGVINLHTPITESFDPMNPST